MKLLIIPTLNESENITPLFKKIKKVDKNLDVLFVDDNSSDGTKERNLISKEKKISQFILFLDLKNILVLLIKMD